MIVLKFICKKTLDFKCPMEVYDKEQYELIIKQDKDISKVDTYKKELHKMLNSLKKFNFCLDFWGRKFLHFMQSFFIYLNWYRNITYYHTK